MNFRTTKLSHTAKKYIEQEMKAGKERTAIILRLIEEGIQKVTNQAGHHQTRGESIDTHQLVFRKKKILIPCPNTMRWADFQQDCRNGCKLKCKLTQDQKLLIKSLLLFSEPIET